MIRWLVGVVTVAAVLWCGWWVVGSRMVLRATEAAVEDLRAEGWEIAYDDLGVSGFPNRFDTTIDAPVVASPDGAFGFSAPFLQVFALSYRPNHLIGVAPHEMAFRTPGGTFSVTSEDLRGSVVGSALSAPVLMRSILTGTGVEVSAGDLGVRVGAGQIATRQAGSEAVHDVAVTLSGVTLSPVLRALVDPGDVLPEAVGALTADAQVTLTEAVGAGHPPRVVAVEVRNGALVWGEVRVAVDGWLDVAGSIPEGRLTLRAEGWRQVLNLAAGLGLVGERQVPLLAAGLGGLADEDGAVTLDLVIADGQMTLGSFPLGPVPEL